LKQKETQNIIVPKKVISSLSYGVIDYNFNKENGSLFSPKIDTGNPSPWSKMGYLDKVYFRFPTKFWNDAEFITFSMEQDFKNNQTAKTVKCDYFYNLDRFFKDVPDAGSNSLFCFLSTGDLELIGLMILLYRMKILLIKSGIY
jgi:hypothetical protein